jgi:hypothetical protein
VEPTDSIAFVRRYNAWRRGDDDSDMPHPKDIGESLDALCDYAERLERELDFSEKTGRQIWSANERLKRERNDAREELKQLKEKYQ